MWWFLIGIVLAFIFAPTVTDTHQTLDSTNFPRVTETDPVPVIYGRVRLRGPNTLWNGDFNADPQYVSEVMVFIANAFRIVPLVGNAIADWLLSKIPISGYKYYLGLDLGLCLGPDVVLHKVYADKNIYFDSTTSGAGVMQYDDKFNGPFTFYPGGFTQSVDSYVASHAGGDAPGYNGICHIVINHAYIGMSPQLPPLSFELSRYSNNLGLTNPVLYIGEDLNPMEIAYSVMTDPWNGMNNDPADIDIASFQAAAAVLAVEQNGSSVIITTASNTGEVLKELMQQVDGIMYQDVATGKISVKLIRQDYDITTIPLLDESNIIDLQNFTRSSWVNTSNQVRIKYTRRDKQYEDGTAAVQDLSLITAQGRMLTTDITMQTVYETSLANRLASRELAQRNIPVFTMTFEVNRSAFGMKPGDVFKFAWAEFNIVNMIMRVKQIDLGKLQDNRMVIEAAQDEFSTSIDAFGDPEGGGGGINFQTQNVVQPLVIELPKILANMDITLLNDAAGASEGFLVAFGEAGSTTQIGYKTIHSTDSFATTIYGLDVITEFAATAVLLTAINPTYFDITRIIPTLLINAVNFGSRTMANATTAQIKTGKNLIFIEGEILGYETIVDNHDGTWSLGNVHRTLLDTAAGDHTYGTQIYFITDYHQFVPVKFNDSLPIQTRFRSVTPTSTQAIDDSSVTTVFTSLVDRYIKPLPPRNMSVEILTVPSADIDTTTTPPSIIGGWLYNTPSRTSGQNVPAESGLRIHWLRRDFTKTDITLFNEADQAPESGVTYNLRWILNSVSTTISSITNNYQDINLPPATVGTLTFELETVRDGHHSFTKELYSIDVV